MVGKLQLYFSVIGGVALLVLALILRNKQLKEKADDLQSYRDTRQRIDKADRSTGDVDSDLEWLRRRAKSRSGESGVRPVGESPRFSTSRRDSSSSYIEW